MKNKEFNWLIIGIVLVVLFSGFGMMGFSNYGYGGMMYSYGFMSSFGWIYMVLVSTVLVLLIIWLFKQIQK